MKTGVVFFDILIPKCPKYQNFYMATQMEHDQSSYFCRGPDDFCRGPAPVGPTLVMGSLSPQLLAQPPSSGGSGVVH